MSAYFETVQQLGFKHSTSQQKGKGRISSLSSISKQLFKAHYDGYQARMSRQLATALKRYINTRPKHERKTPEFIDEVRKKIFCLHEYNLEIAKVKFKYPRSEQFDAVLVQYVNLECELLYGTYKKVDKECENNVIQRVIRLLRVILHDALHNGEVPLKATATACDKALLKLIISVRTDFTSENKLVAVTVIKLLQRLNLLEDINKLKGKNIAFQQDTFLRNPLVSTIRQSLTTSDYESDMYDDDDDDDMLTLNDDIFTSRRQQKSFSQKDEKVKMKRSLKNFNQLSSSLNFREHNSSLCAIQNQMSDSLAGNRQLSTQKDNLIVENITILRHSANPPVIEHLSTGERSHDITSHANLKIYQEKKSNFLLVDDGRNAENSSNQLIVADGVTFVGERTGALSTELNNSSFTINNSSTNQSSARAEHEVVPTNGISMETEGFVFQENLKNGTSEKEVAPTAVSLKGTDQETFDIIKDSTRSTFNQEKKPSISVEREFFREKLSQIKDNGDEQSGTADVTKMVTETTVKSMSTDKSLVNPVITSSEQSEIVEIIDDLYESNSIPESDVQITLKSKVPDLVNAMDTMCNTTVEPSGSGTTDNFCTSAQAAFANSFSKDMIHHAETVNAGIITIEILDDDDDDNNYMGFSLNGNEGQLQSNFNNSNRFLQSNEIKLEENEENRSPNFSVPVSDDNNEQFANSEKNSKNTSSTSLNKLDNNSSKDSANEADVSAIISDFEDETVKASLDCNKEQLNSSDDVLNKINDALNEMNAENNNVVTVFDVAQENEKICYHKKTNESEHEKTGDIECNELSTGIHENVANVDDAIVDTEKKCDDQNLKNIRSVEANENREEIVANLIITETEINVQTPKADEKVVHRNFAKVNTVEAEVEELKFDNQEAEKKSKDEDSKFEKEDNEVVDHSDRSGVYIEETKASTFALPNVEINDDIPHKETNINVAEKEHTFETSQEIGIPSELPVNSETNYIDADENEDCFEADITGVNVAYETEIVTTNLQNEPGLLPNVLWSNNNKDLNQQIENLNKNDELETATSAVDAITYDTEKHSRKSSEKGTSDKDSTITLVLSSEVEESRNITTYEIESPRDHLPDDEGLTNEIQADERKQGSQRDTNLVENENHAKCERGGSCTTQNMELPEEEQTFMLPDSVTEVQNRKETDCQIPKNLAQDSNKNTLAPTTFDETNGESDSFWTEDLSRQGMAEKRNDFVQDEIEQTTPYKNVNCIAPALLQNDEQNCSTEAAVYDDQVEKVIEATTEECDVAVTQKSSTPENECYVDQSTTDVEHQENLTSELYQGNIEADQEVTCEAIDYFVPAQYVIHKSPDGIGYVNDALHEENHLNQDSHNAFVYSHEQTAPRLVTSNGITQNTQDVASEITPAETSLSLYTLSSTIAEMKYINYDSQKKGGGDLELLANIAADQETLAVKTDSEKETFDPISDIESHEKLKVPQSAPKRRSKLKFEYKKKGVVREVSPRTIKQLRRRQTLRQVANIKEVKNKIITRNMGLKIKTSASPKEMQTLHRRNEDSKYKPHDFISTENSVLPPRKNNVYAQKRLMETHTTSEDSNDSCENTLFIDLGDNLKNVEKSIKSTFEEEMLYNKLKIVSCKHQTVTFVNIPEIRGKSDSTRSGINCQRVRFTLPEDEGNYISFNFQILKRMRYFVENSGRRNNVPKVLDAKPNVEETIVRKSEVSGEEEASAKDDEILKCNVRNASLPEQKDADSLFKNCSNETKIVKTTDHSIDNILSKSPLTTEVKVSLYTFSGEPDFNRDTNAKSPTFGQATTLLHQSSLERVARDVIKASSGNMKIPKSVVLNDDIEKSLYDIEDKTQLTSEDLTNHNSGAISDENYEKTFKTKASVKSYEDRVHPDSYLHLPKQKITYDTPTELGTKSRPLSKNFESKEQQETHFDRSRSSSLDFSPISTTFDSTDFSETDITQESDATQESSATQEFKEITNFSTSIDTSAIKNKTTNDTSNLTTNLDNLHSFSNDMEESKGSADKPENKMCIDNTTNNLNKSDSKTREETNDLESSNLFVNESSEDKDAKGVVCSKDLPTKQPVSGLKKKEELREEVNKSLKVTILLRDKVEGLNISNSVTHNEAKREFNNDAVDKSGKNLTVINYFVKDLVKNKLRDCKGKQKDEFNVINKVETNVGELNSFVNDLGSKGQYDSEAKEQEEINKELIDKTEKHTDNKLPPDLNSIRQLDNKEKEQELRKESLNTSESDTKESIDKAEKDTPNEFPKDLDTIKQLDNKEKEQELCKEALNTTASDAVGNAVVEDLEKEKQIDCANKDMVKLNKEELHYLENHTNASKDLKTQENFVHNEKTQQKMKGKIKTEKNADVLSHLGTNKQNVHGEKKVSEIICDVSLVNKNDNLSNNVTSLTNFVIEPAVNYDSETIRQDNTQVSEDFLRQVEPVNVMKNSESLQKYTDKSSEKTNKFLKAKGQTLENTIKKMKEKIEESEKAKKEPILLKESKDIEKTDVSLKCAEKSGLQQVNVEPITKSDELEKNQARKISSAETEQHSAEINKKDDPKKRRSRSSSKSQNSEKKSERRTDKEKSTHKSSRSRSSSKSRSLEKKDKHYSDSDIDKRRRSESISTEEHKEYKKRRSRSPSRSKSIDGKTRSSDRTSSKHRHSESKEKSGHDNKKDIRKNRSSKSPPKTKPNEQNQTQNFSDKNKDFEKVKTKDNNEEPKLKVDVAKLETESKTTHKETSQNDKTQKNNTDRQIKSVTTPEVKIDRKSSRMKSNRQVKAHENHLEKLDEKRNEKSEEKSLDKKVEDQKNKEYNVVKTVESSQKPFHGDKHVDELRSKAKEKSLESQVQPIQDKGKHSEILKKDDAKNGNKLTRSRSKEKGRPEKDDEHKNKLKEKTPESQSQPTRDQEKHNEFFKKDENVKNGNKSIRGHSKEKTRLETSDEHKIKLKEKNEENQLQSTQHHEKHKEFPRKDDNHKNESKSVRGHSKEKDRLENGSRINKREKINKREDKHRDDRDTKKMNNTSVKDEVENGIQKANENPFQKQEKHSNHGFEEIGNSSIKLGAIEKETTLNYRVDSSYENKIKVNPTGMPKKRKFDLYEETVSSTQNTTADASKSKIAKIGNEITISNKNVNEDQKSVIQQIESTNVTVTLEQISVKEACEETVDFSMKNTTLTGQLQVNVTNADDIVKENCDKNDSQIPTKQLQSTDRILSSKEGSTEVLFKEMKHEKPLLKEVDEKNINSSFENISSSEMSEAENANLDNANVNMNENSKNEQPKFTKELVSPEATFAKQLFIGVVENAATVGATEKGTLSLNPETSKNTLSTTTACISYDNFAGDVNVNSTNPHFKNEDVTKLNGVAVPKLLENNQERNEVKTWSKGFVSALTTGNNLLQSTTSTCDNQLMQTDSDPTAQVKPQMQVETHHKVEYVDTPNILLQNEFVPISSSQPMCVAVFSSSDSISVQHLATVKNSTVRNFSKPITNLSFVHTAATAVTTDCTAATGVSVSCGLSAPLTSTNTSSCAESAVRDKTCLFAFNEDTAAVNRENLNTSDIFHTSLGLEDISPTKLPLASNQSLDLISPSTSIAEISNSMNLVQTLGTSSINFEVPDTSEIDIQQASKQNSFGTNFVTRVTEISCYVEKESTADHNYTLGDPLLGGNNEDKNILTTGLSLSNSPEEFQLNESHLEDLSFNENNFIEENGTLEELGLLLPCKKEKPDFDNIIDDAIPKPEDIQNSIKHLNMLVEQGAQAKTISVDNVIDQHPSSDCSVSLGIDYAVSKLLFLGGSDVTSQNNSFSTIPDIENISIIESTIQQTKHSLEEVSVENNEESNAITAVGSSYPSFMSTDVKQKVVVEPVEQCSITSMDQLKKDYITESSKIDENIKPVIEKSPYEPNINQSTHRSSPFATFLESVKRDANKTDTSKVKDELENCIARKYNRTPLSTSKKKAQHHSTSPAHKKTDDLHSTNNKNNTSQTPSDASKGGRIRVKTDLIKATDSRGIANNNSISSLDFINEHDQSIASEVILPFNKPPPEHKMDDSEENKTSDVIPKNSSGNTKHARFDKMGKDYIMENILNVCKEPGHKSPMQDLKPLEKPVEKPDVTEINNKRKLNSSDNEHRRDDKRLKKSDDEVGKNRNISDNSKMQIKKSDSGIPSIKPSNDDIFDKLLREGPVNKVFTQRLHEQKSKKETSGASTSNTNLEMLKNRGYPTTPDSHRRERMHSSHLTSSHGVLYDSSKYKDFSKLQKRPGHTSNSGVLLNKRLTDGRQIAPIVNSSSKRYVKSYGNSYSSKSDPCTVREYRSRDRRMSTEQPNSLFPESSRSEGTRKEDDKFSWIDKFSGTGLFDTPSHLFMPPGNKREDTSCRK